MDALGNALTLYELGVRVVAFINDLRHAQDDFIALRAEADCLRVCLNSLGSESCQDTIYLYISHKQRQDLELILQNTLLNMEDLNRFLGGTKALVANEAKKIARQQGGGGFRDFMKDAWARYKFVMTDVQPFRDKLVIPTQSVQIFLQSMTHVGLANVGNLLALSGHLPGTKGSPDTPSGPVGGWEVIGTKIAFKKAKDLGNGPLTADLEGEIIRYVLHLRQGGKAFDAKPKVQVKEKRSRSKSQTTPASAKDKSYDTFVVRRKTSQTASPVRRLEAARDASWSATDRKSLRLEIPPSSPSGHSPTSPTSPRIFDAKPHFEVSSDEEEIEAPRRYSFSDIPSPRRESAPPEAPMAPPAVPHLRRESNSRSRTRSTDNVRTSRQICRQKVEEEIKLEQEEAAQELRQGSMQMRSRRRTRRRTETRIHPDQDEIASSSDDEDIMEFLEEQYGLRVEKLYVDRNVVDNGTVVPHVPASLVEPDEPEEITKPNLPKRGARLTSETSFYDSAMRSKRARYTRPHESIVIPRGEEILLRPGQSPRHAHYHTDSSEEESVLSKPEPKSFRSSAPDVIIVDHDKEKDAEVLRRRKSEGRAERRTTDLNRSKQDAAKGTSRAEGRRDTRNEK